ncbi:unnamed protein product [Paramecium primaurelia]|uniref:Uncharacterized protein n=1 Tax=Paramecium primaurelia TaxID=5886 RepID=A0A8S1P2B4_PARPR|nr:unnamed protein product [Paramecium primaurelia]
MTINRPQILGNYQLIPLISLRGYDINNAANIRLKYTNVAFNVEKISHLFLQNKKQQQFNIYFDKQRLSNYILRVNFCNIKSLLLRSYFIYDLNYKAFDPYCAELFFERDFNGDTIIICDKVPDLQALEWSKPIRSISIPKYSILFLFGMVNYQGVKQSVIQTQQCDEFTNIQSANFQPTVSNIKVLFLNNCLTVKFYSQCNYQGIIFQITKGQNLLLSIKIPFEIISISTCPNIIIKLKAPNYFGGSVKEITTSQSCMISYKFPKYQANQ